MFYQTVNIAMNNAWILYTESLFPQERGFGLKANYLHEIAYRMARPFAVEKYQSTNRRHQEIKTMIDMVFRLNNDEKAGAPATAPDPVVDPAAAADAADAPAPAPAPARLGRQHTAPAQVAGATRDVPTEAQANPVVPYLGGRWTSTARFRCSLCPKSFNWRGKLKCEIRGG